MPLRSSQQVEEKAPRPFVRRGSEKVCVVLVLDGSGIETERSCESQSDLAVVLWSPYKQITGKATGCDNLEGEHRFRLSNVWMAHQ